MKRKVIDHRYKILKKLGAGAMGDVYQVKDLKNDSLVALKLLSKKETTSATIIRFKREFRLLAELHHPNLCSVYDFGTLRDGRSYFTMEFVDGKDIFKAAKDLSYEKIYPWVVQLCRVLEYIHSKGLIHYDIKPGNVLIHKTGDKTVVRLMDFGLVGEQEAKDGTIIRGTFPYIAPEVMKGLAVDHRADLYSLGVLIYELFTRELVKLDKKNSFSSLLQQSIQLSSTLPSKIGTGISASSGLERLIVRLINSEPAGRFSRANEVIKQINRLSRVKFAFETKKTLEGYLLSSRFVGRDKEMDILKSLYKKAKQGESKVVLITGDVGIGKSRLLGEFKIFTQMERSHTFIGYAHKDKITPLEPFYDIFSELINCIENWPNLFQSRELKLSLAILFKMFPKLTIKRLKKNLPKLVPLDSKQENLRTYDALTELITHCVSQLGEIVILLEDLHWADDLSVQFLEYLGRNIEKKNILICATCREEELMESKVLKRIINNMKNEGHLEQIELKPFTYKNLYSFLNSTITSTSNSSRLTRYLMSKTDGNPFFVEEILRTLLQMRKVNIGERIEIEELKKIRIPRTIADVTLERITDLDENSLKIINFAAVLLKDFTFYLMKKLTGLEDNELSYSLWELKRRGVIVEQNRRYQFYHVILREAVHKRLGDKEKRELNYQVGKILEKINKGKHERITEDLAYYFINARDRKKGIRYGLQTAERCRDRYANEQAIRIYSGVLALLGNKEPRRRFGVLQKLAQVEYLVGHHDKAIRTYSKAIIMKTGTIYKKIKIYSTIGSIYECKGEYNNTLRIYQMARKLFKKMKPGRLKTLSETHINVRIYITKQRMGDYKSVNKFNFDAVKLPHKDLIGKEMIRLLANIYNTIGNIEYQKAAYSKADFDRAIFYYNKAYKYYKMIKAETGIVAARTNLGLCYYMKNNFQKAIDCCQKSIRTSENTGNQYSVSLNLLNLGIIFMETGCYSRAVERFQMTLSISIKIGNHLVTGYALSYLGWCFVKLCDYKRAEGYFEKASKIFDTLGLIERKTYQIVGIGEIHHAKGNYTLALRFFGKALKISQAIGHQLTVAESFIHIGLLNIEIGKFLKAKRYIKKALNIAVGIGAKDIELECNIGLGRINTIMSDYVTAHDYYEKGIRTAKESGLKLQVLRFLLLLSEIYYHERKYLKGIKIANRAIKIAKQMGTKDLFAEALVLKAKNGLEQDIFTKIEIMKTLSESKGIAEEIGCPEVLWKVYFEYGLVFQRNKRYLKALEYYEKCNGIFNDVISKIKNESYRICYLSRPDRQAVDSAIKEIKKSLD